MLVAVHTPDWSPNQDIDHSFKVGQHLICSVRFGTEQHFATDHCTDAEYHYCTRRPIRRLSSGDLAFIPSIADPETILQEAINNIVGIHVSLNGIAGYSAHAIRGRLYYLLLQGRCLLMSDDLRSLLPYSGRKLDPAACINMLKYGSVPERVTVVTDIRTIPVAQVLRADPDAIGSIIQGKRTVDSLCSYYHRLRFPMDGGDLAGLRRHFDSTFRFIAGLAPVVPMSGGIDSTLIGRIIDRYSDEAFPAYFIRFGDEDPELTFAKEAAKGTKAELEVVTLNPSQLIPGLLRQAELLIEPVGETSPLATALFLSDMPYSGRCIIDGTMADGCFGTTVYTRSLFHGQRSRPRWQQELNERIAAFLIWNRLPGSDRFFPRDSAADDPYIQLMNMYLGPFGNTWLKGAADATAKLMPLWTEYFGLLDDSIEPDDWMKVISVKMTNYAGRTQASKSFEGPMPRNCTLYPFSWKSTLEIQGHFTWAEKSEGNIQKALLKKLLTDWMPNEFVYRKKVGLNSDFGKWAQLQRNRSPLIELIDRTDGIAASLVGIRRLRSLTDALRTRPLDQFTIQLLLSLVMLQTWSDRNRVTL